MNHENTKTTFFTGIQILRGFAAIGVMLFHLSFFSHQFFKTPYVLTIGATGIHLFFVISGFVLWKPKEKNAPMFLLGRAIRIYPGYFSAVGIAVVINIIIYNITPKITIEALSLFPFGTGVLYPLGGIEWTLVYEMYFYLILTAIMKFPSSLRACAPALWLFLLISGIFYLKSDSILFKNSEQILHPTYPNILLSSYCLPFIMGLIARQIFNRRRTGGIILLSTIFVCCLASGWSLYGTGGHININTLAYANLLMGLGFSCLVLLFAGLDFHLSSKLVYLLKKMGDWSYGIYLLQFPIITLLLKMYLMLGFNTLSIGLLSFAAIIVVSIGALFGAFESTSHSRIRKYIMVKYL